MNTGQRREGDKAAEERQNNSVEGTVLTLRTEETGAEEYERMIEWTNNGDRK
jgi:hypothetical protein